MSTVDRVALIEAQINALQGYVGSLEKKVGELEGIIKLVGSWAIVNKQFLDSVLEAPKPAPKVEVVTPTITPAA